MTVFKRNVHLGTKEPLIETDDIAGKAVTTEKIGDGAVTTEKIAKGGVEWENVSDDVQNIIASMEKGGVALSGEFGDSELIGINQKKLTEEIGPEGTITQKVATLEETVGEGGSVDERIAAGVGIEKNRAQAAEELLREAYESLSQSQPIPKTAEEWAAMTSWEEGVVYRVAGTTSYTDYMYNGTTTIPMATYDNAIDDEPTSGSNNLVKSGGVYPTTKLADDIMYSKEITGTFKQYKYISNISNGVGVYANVATSLETAIYPIVKGLSYRIILYSTSTTHYQETTRVVIGISDRILDNNEQIDVPFYEQPNYFSNDKNIDIIAPLTGFLYVAKRNTLQIKAVKQISVADNFFEKDLNGIGSILNISTYLGTSEVPMSFPTLASALYKIDTSIADISKVINNGGSIIKFLQHLEDSKYNVIKTADIEEEPSGIELDESLNIESGEYKENELPSIELPINIGDTITYYIGIDGSYTSWSFTKLSNEIEKYVLYKLNSSSWTIDVSKWVCIDELQKEFEETPLSFASNIWANKKGISKYGILTSASNIYYKIARTAIFEEDTKVRIKLNVLATSGNDHCGLFGYSNISSPTTVTLLGGLLKVGETDSIVTVPAGNRLYVSYYSETSSMDNVYIAKITEKITKDDIIELQKEVFGSQNIINFSDYTARNGALNDNGAWTGNNNGARNSHYIIPLLKKGHLTIENESDSLITKCFLLRGYISWKSGIHNNVKEYIVVEPQDSKEIEVDEEYCYLYVERTYDYTSRSIPEVTFTTESLINYNVEDKSINDIFMQPGKLFAIKPLEGQFNIINRLYIEGLLKKKLSSAKINGQVSIFAENPAYGTNGDLIGNNTNFPVVLSADGYTNKSFSVEVNYTQRSKLNNKHPNVLLIGDSLTDGGLSSVVKFIFDCMGYNTTLVGTRNENGTISLGTYSYLENTYHEGRSGRATADHLRHVVTVLNSKADWDMLGLATMTRNGISQRESREDWDGATDERLHLMSRTCHGYFDADPSQELWTRLTSSYNIHTFVLDEITYSFHDTYTTDDDATQIAAVKYLLKNPHKYWDTVKFYDYDTVQSSDGEYAFNLETYLSRYKTLDVDGTTRLVAGETAGTLITNVEQFDVCEPTHVVFITVANDNRLRATGEETANDIALLSTLVNNYNSNIKTLAGTTRLYGVFEPKNEYINIAIPNIFEPDERYVNATEKLKQLSKETGAKFTYLELYATQSPFANQGGKAFDPLNLTEVERFTGDGIHTGKAIGYLDRAYQIVAWIASTY